MNEVILSGIISNIEKSHFIGGVEYYKALLTSKRIDGREDILPIKFKKFSLCYNDGDKVDLIGNIRSHSEPINNEKNRVNIYVFTYFDPPSTDENYEDVHNRVVIDGRICKKDALRTTESGKNNIHFILANNIIISDEQKLNNYLPCVAWGKNSFEVDKLKVSDRVKIVGELHSRVYKKEINGEIELKTAYELVVNTIEVLND